MTTQSIEQSPFPLLSALLKQVWYFPVIRGATAIGFGLVLLIWPAATILVVVVTLGLLWILDGVISIVDGFRNRAQKGAWFRILFGILSVIAGVILVSSPISSAMLLFVFAGVWAVIFGIAFAIGSFAAKPTPGWGAALVVSLLTIGVGVLMLTLSFETAVVLKWVVGLYAIGVGVVLVLLGFQIRSASKRLAA